MLSLSHLFWRLISTLLKLEISTLLKTITNSCFQALEGLKFQALEGLKFQDKQTQKQMIRPLEQFKFGAFFLSCNCKSKISVWSYKSSANLCSVSSNLHRFKRAFAQLIFSILEKCWWILREIQTVQQRYFILSSKLKLTWTSFLGSLSCNLS